MAWTKLSERVGIGGNTGIEGLPLVLAGPIVRKTTYNEVSVWIAFKTDVGSVTLTIFSTDNKESEPIATATHACFQFGPNLWITLVTINIAPPRSLLSGNIYYYNLYFNNPISEITTDAVTVIGKNKIVYNGNTMPSFILPPSDVTQLRLFHGSCRKPHGGKPNEPDAITILDKILAESNSDPANRPQLLILTGDQIYADDVSDVMAYMIKDIRNALLRFNESLPFSGPQEESTFNELAKRKPIMNKYNITSGEGDNHLAYLSDFFAMYLLAWSDALWDKNELPSVQDLYGNIKEYSEQIIPDRVDREGFVYKGRTERIRNKIYIKHDRNKNLILNYKEGSVAIRKILANIITYMQFDDHEVTDDWFISHSWSTNINTRDSFFNHLIKNALSAFLVFQGWGNDPNNAKYNNVIPIISESTINGLRYGDLVELLVPKMEDTKGGTKLVRSSNTMAVNWNHRIEYDSIRIIILDTRNRRYFDSDRVLKSNAGLVEYYTLRQQLGIINDNQLMDDGKITFVVSPSPVGNKGIDTFAQQGSSIWSRKLADSEAWELHPFSFLNLLKFLSLYQRVVILSGDIHIAQTFSMEFWYKGTERRMMLFSACSSGLKNTRRGTPGEFTGTYFNNEPNSHFLAWETNAEVIYSRGGSSPIEPYALMEFDVIIPKEEDYGSKYSFSKRPDFEFKTQSLKLDDYVLNEKEPSNRVVLHLNIGEISFEGAGDNLYVNHRIRFHPSNENNFVEIIHKSRFRLPSNPLRQ